MRQLPANDIITLVGSAPRFDLAESLGPDLRLSELLEGPGGSSLGDLALGYGTAEGNPALREAIGGLHGVGADDLLVTVGGMHALFLLAFVLCDRGDEAVTTSPVFPPARNAMETVGATVRSLRLSFDRGYRLDPGELGKLLSARTKLVSLASPQNPSGVALSEQVLRDVLVLMRDKCPDAYLIVDETYREAAYGDDPVAPSAISLGPRVISVASLSKCHGAPGLRLGWAITRDAALRRQLVLGKFNSVISCSPLDEALALEVLGQRERILGKRRKQLADGLRITTEWVQQNSALVDWVRPNAGAICCVRLKPGAFDDAAVGHFHAALAERAIRVANGTWFGDEARVFRLGFGWLSPADLRGALEGVSAALRQTARDGVS
jgi:aspartate/methionine/tyrosine aminotransferase